MNRICTRVVRMSSDCLTDLAAGWILPNDLCPLCTSTFMAALDEQTGRRLPWHHAFLARARRPVQIHDEDDGSLWAVIVDMPGCFASGFTIVELVESLQESVRLWRS